MAKRRQLEVPSPEALKEIEEGFARETSRKGIRAPIADVAADAAAHSDPLPQHLREENARDRADAKLLREAREKGLVVIEIPIEQIREDALTRDRLELDEEEMGELTRSISEHGMRLPIEVFEPANPDAAGRYALISGYRRLAAARRINEMTEGARFASVPAFIRSPSSISDALVAMVEENEIRVGLSQYERGRAATIAVYDGVFATVDQAVKTLFKNASRAKQSKIRSFALVHEELGDMLSFAKHLNERQCLRIASGLRAGQTEAMRHALEVHSITDAETEWSVLEPIIEGAEGAPQDRSRGGRPRKVVERSAPVALANGVTMEKVSTEDGYAIRLRGKHVNDEMIEQVMDKIRWLLEEI